MPPINHSTASVGRERIISYSILFNELTSPWYIIQLLLFWFRYYAIISLHTLKHTHTDTHTPTPIHILLHSVVKIPPIDIYPRDLKTDTQIDIHMQMFIAALFQVAKN